MKKTKNVLGTEKLEEKLNLMFDTLLIQTVQRGITYDEFVVINTNNEFFGEFQQLSSWKQKYGYTFNVYNDHFIESEKHFHFDNKEKNVHLRMDFKGNVLDGKGQIDKKVHKVLKKFIQQESVYVELNQLWNKNNLTNE